MYIMYLVQNINDNSIRQQLIVLQNNITLSFKEIKPVYVTFIWCKHIKARNISYFQQQF